MKSKKTDWYLILILLIGGFVRFYLLDIKPPHHDEGVNGWFAEQIASTGFYHYDPSNYHGPLHFYILYIFKILFGRNLYALRAPSIIFSLLSIYWVTLFSRFFSRKLCLIAALAIAISPGCVFYSRYAIHETGFVFFNILTLWGLIGLFYEGRLRYLISTCFGITLMILTKETYVIHLACLLVTFLFVLIAKNRLGLSLAKQSWNIKDLVIILFLCCTLIVYFYSDAFSDFKALSNLYLTFTPWVKAGTESGGHAKSCFYWLKLFVKYESIALAGLILSFGYIFKSQKLIKAISIYGVLIFLIYSIIPYKTPWCIISILWPFYFVFGNFFTDCLQSRWRNEIVLISALIFICSLVSCRQLNFINYANKNEPYVYVQTFPDINNVSQPILQLVKENPAYYNLKGVVLHSSEWPLPWILGDFKRIFYYKSLLDAPTYNVDFLFIESKYIKEVEKELNGDYFTRVIKLRDAQGFSKAYFSYPLFKSVFPGKHPNFTPRKMPHRGHPFYRGFLRPKT